MSLSIIVRFSKQSHTILIRYGSRFNKKYSAVEDAPLFIDTSVLLFDEKTGNIFDPDYFILDEKAHLVYRKEQFEFDDQLASEYVIADYRFTKDEICNAFESCGLSVKSANYVQAGRWQTPLASTDNKAKEILLIAQKNK